MTENLEFTENDILQVIDLQRLEEIQNFELTRSNISENIQS